MLLACIVHLGTKGISKIRKDTLAHPCLAVLSKHVGWCIYTHRIDSMFPIFVIKTLDVLKLKISERNGQENLVLKFVQMWHKIFNYWHFCLQETFFFTSIANPCFTLWRKKHRNTFRMKIPYNSLFEIDIGNLYIKMYTLRGWGWVVSKRPKCRTIAVASKMLMLPRQFFWF